MEKALKKLLHHIPNTIRSLRTFQNMAASKTSCTITGKTYEDAIAVLNELQSNAQVRAEIAANRSLNRKEALLADTVRTVEKMGVSKDMMDSLNVIHVAGTKGKGTTCAFTESILRHAGLRTGFFSSPHLIAVRERIKINGEPISPEMFAHYFFETYENLVSSKEEDYAMPAYFKFLTCMAFYVFCKEKVDVAILEVGIGGRHDSTNIISKPTVVGITSLGLEHQSILGQTLEEIALNKAGIMKENAPAFTVHNHLPHITQILAENALNVKCPFYIAPPLEEYPVRINLSVDDGNVSKLNAALAIQLANNFLKIKYPEKLKASVDKGIIKEILPFHVTGLQSTNWPGRFQILEKSKNLRYFLDGAHTLESVAIAMNWFLKCSNRKSFRILVFHLTGERVAPEFLEILAKSEVFNLAIFCPLVILCSKSKNDNWSALLEGQDLLKSCQEHCNLWKKFVGRSNGLVIDSIDGTINFIRQLHEKKSEIPAELDALYENFVGVHDCKPVDVLITGSLHLVGNFLSILCPESTY